MFISGISIVYEFTGAENRATYIGLANTVPGVAGAIAPLIGGWLVGVTSFQTMFILAGLIGATGWALLHFGVREPRKMQASLTAFQPSNDDYTGMA
jgi:MFS family permease